MKISKITVQKKQKDRYNIFMKKENVQEEYAFSVDESVLVKWSLQKGKVLTENEAEAIIQQDLTSKAYNKALQYLTHSMRTEYQIRKHLRNKEYDENIIEEVLQKLKEYRYINDEEYAQAYVRTQINTAVKGPVLIKDDLSQRGVSESEIEHALSLYTEDIQIEKAQSFLLKKGTQKKNESAVGRKKRLVEALLRRGFMRDIAWKAYERAQHQLPEDNDADVIFEQGEKWRKKWETKYSGKQLEWKLKQKLYQKGFDLHDIDKYLRHIEANVNEEEV